jgi:hypothetical protein
MPRKCSNLSDRFWPKVARGQPDECWPWTACRHAFGYGKIGVAGRVEFAHRVAWTLTNGPIPAGLYVLHHCDNPPCCNPAHLWLGTYADNNADKAAKGRSHRPERRPVWVMYGDANPSRKYPGIQAGERNGFAKLTAADALSIRARSEAGESNASIARAYGLPTATIWKVVHRESWRHV